MSCGMEALVGAAYQRATRPTTAEPEPTWLPDRSQGEPDEWPAVLEQVSLARRRIGRAMADANPSSPALLDALLERLHASRPTLLAHARRISRYAGAIARELRLPVLACLHIERAALVHDIGKLTLPDTLRAAYGPRAARELVLVRSHSTMAAEMAYDVPYLRATAPLILSAHERFGGHPTGAAGESIPLGGRIIAVADAWDAFAGAPDERDDRATECANLELVRHAGPHFDPAVVRAWLRVSETVEC
jgi:response regulator RpfG family c-di-GMP phosphodiesterase